ncbi:MAG: synthase subunit delta [Bacteroidota bacterium]|jgi:F-type H+-transporting ATPase subunit delta
MAGIRISSRYAKALLELNKNEQEQDMAFADMKHVAAVIDSSRDLEVFLQSPVVKKDKKVNVLTSIFGADISKTTLAFIVLLTQKGREGLLHEVAVSFVHQYKVMRNITEANVVVAAPLDDNERSGLLAIAGKVAGGKVELAEKVNPEIIGGFILNVADRQLDASVSSQLTSLRREFSENPFVPEF